MLAYVSSEKKLPIPMSVGICAPIACKQADLNEMKPYILPVLNDQLKYFFADIEGFDLKNVTLANEDIKFDMSRELNDLST